MEAIKNSGICAIAVVLFIGSVSFQAKAQAVTQSDSTKKQLDRLMASQDPADRYLLNQRLKQLAASDIEMDMAIAGSYYFQLKKARTSDSVFNAEMKKFPNGLQARIKAQQAISGIKSLPKLEQAYTGFIKHFPPESYPSLSFGEDRLPYDRLRSIIATEYAKEKNVAKAGYYAGLLEADFWKGKSYGDVADAFYANGDLVNAALYQKKALESAEPYAEGKMGNSPAANFAAKGYAGECRTYALILFDQKKYHEALTYMERAVKASRAPGADFNYAYAKILAALNRNQEAYDRVEAAVKSGEATQQMADLFKVLYVKVKGSDAGLDAYEADIRKGVMENLRKKLTKNRISEPAPNFKLTDLQGNQVTLSDLKGKVVILDFWATWCGPCKASFPAMQMAVDKYKNDPTVKFLFIHTWERTTTPAEDARAYIAGMKYNFQVLMDTKDPEIKANKVVESYKVSSIPAKFVIDEKGDIRFRLTGFNGSNEAAVDEISMMIALLKAKD